MGKFGTQENGLHSNPTLTLEEKKNFRCSKATTYQTTVVMLELVVHITGVGDEPCGRKEYDREGEWKLRRNLSVVALRILRPAEGAVAHLTVHSGPEKQKRGENPKEKVFIRADHMKMTLSGVNKPTTYPVWAPREGDQKTVIIAIFLTVPLFLEWT
uniref:Uncharacterized protein n=1 Tax=Steinernema glaseri TaxID=37863 RepID=A0A1I7YZJ1_9BILA